MYRRKTVEALLRHHARRENELLQVIREQNDRLMLLAGVQYSPTPLELHNIDEPVADLDETVDVGQAADDLGHAVY